MSAAPGHAAIVLAAGGSRRLGRPKQLLTRDGEALVHRAARLAAATQPLRLLVALGAFDDRVESALAGVAFERIANPDWPRGLGTSLRACAHALSAHRGPTLIVGCDQPALDAAHLQALLALAAQAPSGCAATAHGAARGIPAVVAADVLAQALSFDGDRGFGAAFSALGADALGVLDAPGLRIDVDDEAGLRAAIEAGLLDGDGGTKHGRA